MVRRVHVAEVSCGAIALGDGPAHHARDVLRLRTGDDVELFDAAGRVGRATLVEVTATRVIAQVTEIVRVVPRAVSITVAAAPPKSARADWMIEKLCELGVDRFIPLITDRGVALGDGPSKPQRWQRLAVEAARQSRRAGIMAIDAPLDLDRALREAMNQPDDGALNQKVSRPAHQTSPSPLEQATHQPSLAMDQAATAHRTSVAWWMGFSPKAIPMAKLIDLAASPPAKLTLFIGPEGGWTESESNRFTAAGIVEAALTRTVLRVETAAIAAAAFAACAWSDIREDDPSPASANPG